MATKKTPHEKKKLETEKPAAAADDKTKKKAAPKVKKAKDETAEAKPRKRAGVRKADESVAPTTAEPKSAPVPVSPPPAPAAPISPPARVAPAAEKQPAATPPRATTPTFSPPKEHKRPPEPQRPSVPQAARPAAPAPVVMDAAIPKRKVPFNEMMSVKDLAAAMDAKVTDVIRKLLSLGAPATINQRIDSETATLVADAFGFELELKSIYTEDTREMPEKEAQLKPRPPVVTVMGHVDHGKTSLLDAIRSTNVAKGEAGGITQHIGAYQVKTPKGVITFLDTPGHEAFTAMRARGAMVTDIVILVVAADDSVMPQTIEAIDHAKAAGVPIVVAINKVDLPGANVQRVKQELAQHDVVSEDWGGKTVTVEVSAKTRHNVDKLIEMILLEAELLELKANPDRPARGVVLEARLDPKRGNTATMLVQAGTLRVGDTVICGLSYGRVRAMTDEFRRPIQAAGPSVPVEVLGLSQVPQVGDQFSVVTEEREAREIADRRGRLLQEASKKKPVHLSLESLHSQIAEGKIRDLPIILKADVQGSLQAIQDSLGKLAGSPIQLRYVHTGVGNVNSSDVLLGEASDAVVFGFNVRVESGAEAEAKRAGVDIRTYQIIYEMLADVRAAMEGLLKPEEVEVVKGRAQVKDVFPSSKFGAVAGCLVNEGKITRGAKARLLRGTQVVAATTVASLRRFKEDVKEAEKGYECGISLEGVKSYNRGDLIETFVIEKRARRLEG